MGRAGHHAAGRRPARRCAPSAPTSPSSTRRSRHRCIVRGFLNSASPRQYSFLRGGALGWGMPAAVGCSLGLGREPVVCLVGDGAALYSPQALWTAAHEKLPVTFVVMNNREYNILKNFMRGLRRATRRRAATASSPWRSTEPAIDYPGAGAIDGRAGAADRPSRRYRAGDRGRDRVRSGPI